MPEVTELRKSVFHSVLSACGVHPALAGETSAGALREAWRVVLHGTLTPVSKNHGRRVRQEAWRSKLGDQLCRAVRIRCDRPGSRIERTC